LHNAQNIKNLIQTADGCQHPSDLRLFSRIIDDKQMSNFVYSTTVQTCVVPVYCLDCESQLCGNRRWTREDKWSEQDNLHIEKHICLFTIANKQIGLHKGTRYSTHIRQLRTMMIRWSGSIRM